MVSRQVVSPKGAALGQHGTLRHVCLSAPKPSEWIGYDSTGESLLLVHDEIPKDQGMTKRLASKVNGQTTTFRDHSAIHLLDSKEMRELDKEAIVELVIAAFRLFYELQR